MDKVLVLGANGFIGSNLVDGLVNSGCAVVAFDNFSNNSPRFKTSKFVETFNGDFFNYVDLEKALCGVKYVFHLISTTNPAISELNPFLDIDYVSATVKLLELAEKEESVEQFLFSSSGGAIYGESFDGCPHKETANVMPISPYGIGKLTIEGYLRYFFRKFGLNSVSFRISNPYGPRQPFNSKQGVIPIFINKILNNESINVLGDGSMTRDYIYIDDVIKAMISVIGQVEGCEIFNVGSGVEVSISSLVIEISELLNLKPIINHLVPPSSFVKRSVLSSDKICNFCPDLINKYGLKSGLVSTIEWIKEKQNEI
jgi:UDP-glucose 4-epimerase